MPWETIESVPAAIRTHRGVKLTLEQANRWAALFDGIKASGSVENPAAVAWTQWNKEYKVSDDGNSWVKIEKQLQEFEPPEAGDAPEEVKGILAKVYTGCRTSWVNENPSDTENPSNKESCARIAWSAVEKAGWKKNAEGKWAKSSQPTLSLMDIRSTVVLQAGIIESIFAKYPPTEEERVWVAFRKREGENSTGWYVDQILIVDGEPSEELIKEVFWEGEWRLFEAHPDIQEVLGHAIVAELPEGGLSFKIERSVNVMKMSDGVPETKCDSNCQTCGGSKMFSSVPTLKQLSEAEAVEVGKTELLMVDGTAIAEGTWKDTLFPADVLKEGIERVNNKRIDVDHQDETWEDVKGFNYKPRWNEKLNGIDVSGAIFDQRVIDWYKKNPGAKIGFSVKLSDKAKFDIINGKKTCTYFDIKGIALTLSPACKTCWVDNSEIVELSSSGDNSSGGGEIMAEQKTKEQLAAEEKAKLAKEAEDKKLAKEAEDKKLADANAEAAKGKSTTQKPEDAVPAPPAAASATELSALTKQVTELTAQVQTLQKANETLGNERSLSETKALVNDLIESGQLSEAKREPATKTLMSLKSDESRAAFLNTIGGKEWTAGEQGLVLSEDKDKDKDKNKDLEFSEAPRNIIT